MDFFLVSIVLTTLNAAQFLRELVDSCLNQAYPHIELIAVDGGSTDGTLEILKEYNDLRISIINQVDNAGKLPGAINLGLEHAHGEYLTWMQADSIYHPQAIEIMQDALENHPEVGQVYADFFEIDTQGQITRTIHNREPEEFLDNIGDPAGVCFLIRRKVREIVGVHNLDAFPSQDYDYRMRIAMQFPSLHIKQPLYYWRSHVDLLTGKLGWVELAKKDVDIRLNLGLDTPVSARRRFSEIDMAYAFECYQNGNFAAVPRLVINGIAANISYIFNRGVWSILLRSYWRILAKSWVANA